MKETKKTMISRYCEYVRDGMTDIEIYKAEKKRLYDDLRMRQEREQETTELLTNIQGQIQKAAEKSILDLLDSIKV